MTWVGRRSTRDGRRAARHPARCRRCSSLPQSATSSVLFGISRHKGVVGALAAERAAQPRALAAVGAAATGLTGVALGTAIPLALVERHRDAWSTAAARCDLPLAPLPVGGHAPARAGDAGVRGAGARRPALFAPDRLAAARRRGRRRAGSLFAVLRVALRRSVRAERARWGTLMPRAVRRRARGRRRDAGGRREACSVSVVIAVYNATWCIERALDSADARRPGRRTRSWCATTARPTARRIWSSSATATRVTVLRLPHRNASATRRRRRSTRATGDWLAFMDADDYLGARASSSASSTFIERHPEIRLADDRRRATSRRTGVIRESWLSDYFDPVARAGRRPAAAAGRALLPAGELDAGRAPRPTARSAASTRDARTRTTTTCGCGCWRGIRAA